MNNDVALIMGIRTALKSAVLDFTRAYCDLSQSTSADTLQNIMNSHVKLITNISQLESSIQTRQDEQKAVLADIHEYLDMQKKQ